MRMQLLVYSLFLLLLAFKQAPGLVATAPDLENVEEKSPKMALSDKSPQLLYMKKLRDMLKDTKEIPTAESDNIGGSLLATSIEAENVTGPGNTTKGLIMQDQNKYVLQVSLPKNREASYIQSAELWIFPQQIAAQQQAGNFKKMKLLVTAELEHATRPRKEVLDVIWDTRMDCIALNVTSLSHKIVRNLEKHQLQQANISVSIEVVSTRLQSEIPTTEYFIDMCDALSEKQTKNPFLVVKYYVEEQPLDSLTDTSHQKRSAVTEPPTTSQNCSVVPLTANITKLFGDFILHPKELEISDCSGSCNVLRNRDSFSNHAYLVEKLKILDANRPTFKHKACCVPTEYKPERLLISSYNRFMIVQFEEMRVTKCGCR